MKTFRLLSAAVIIVFISILSAAPDFARAQEALFPPMDNGELDRPDRPFDYFSSTTSAIGVRYAQFGTEVTPEGYLYTGWSEMGFFAGPKLAPVNQRVKTPDQGYLPIVNLFFSIGGVNYHLQYFSDSLDGTPDGLNVNLIKFTASNPGTVPAEARFGAGTRYGLQLPNRSQRHMVDTLEVMYYSFNPKWKYSVKPDAALRDGKVVYTFDTRADEAYLKEGVPFDMDGKPVPGENGRYDWMAIAAWKRTLAPGESFTVRFVMPIEPAEPKMMKDFRAIDYDASLKKTADSWNEWLAQGATFSVPEKKVDDTWKANLIYMAIALDKEGDDYVQKVNEFQYDSFWLRDASFMLTAFDVMGHPFECEKGSLFFLKWQTPEGNFESQRGQLDGFGQTLWTFGSHYEISRDKAYLEKVWPDVVKSIGWLRDARQKEKNRLKEGDLGYGMMPISNPGDNELVDGHVVGHDFWAMHGLNTIRRAAPDVATPEELAALDAEMADYKKWISYNLDQVVKRTEGYITPALEPGGNDWGNLKLLWPTKLLDPFDRKVTDTLRMAHYKYAEGIMTYDYTRFLHAYIGIDLPQNHLVRNEQTPALHDFYYLLMHTSSTHGGFEWSIRPWGDRNFGGNIAPHGCFAGKYLLLYRNMLVREDGNDLHLGSAFSPYWLRPGKSIVVKNAPTAFGPVSYRLDVREGGATLNILPPSRSRPDRIILHLPQGFDVTSIDADGTVLDNLDRSMVILSPDTSRADIRWKIGAVSPFNFKYAAENYMEVYWQLHPHDTPKGATFEE